ncbi:MULTISPECIES: U32 family peptidase [Clostridia]|jgi:U32 family peptidase|uniref:U32 family peptidase n=1 Tax=Clostridia TaxID=186801 RepID=UPI000E519EEC|nr:MULTISPECIES: U32 family peptidase [Clostridia]RGH41476.1 U32 family peptidase [Firmicutes bacterium AM41-5BH]RKQ32120.1 U32 family peptidase [Ruminococcus sp. B05]TAP36363.1 U32 family peptidase [Mediterraneibacter sp. gm002]
MNLKYDLNKNQDRKIEILAPAGSYESFHAAIVAGADAVYAGGPKFGARAFAENFTEDQLLNAIDYAHLHQRKFYLTVNTLLKDYEIEQLPEYLEPLYQRGLDAVIVQDMGVLNVVRQYFPDMDIHASTQMTVTGVNGAQFLKENGAVRVVPAREISLEEVRNIKSVTGMEMECFVHGALCYCYSGQCLLSSLIGGRSGNRGQCAQPCRLPYTVDGEKGYLLSLKDICTLDIIPDLIESGIDSFKIEGRMKRPEYVAGVTSIYRKYVDLYLKNPQKPYWVDDKDKEMLMDLFNRGGFHTGYYKQKNGRNMITIQKPNHIGVKVGTVLSQKGREVQMRALTDIAAGDLIEFKNEAQRYTTGKSCKQGEVITILAPKGIRLSVGEVLYRVQSPELLNTLETSYSEGKVIEKLYGYISLEAGKAAKLVVCKDEYSVEVESGQQVEAASSRPLDEERIKKQLQKTGNTEFEFDVLDVELHGEVFLPMQQLNEMRRKALEELEKKIQDSFHRKTAEKKVLQEEILDTASVKLSKKENKLSVLVETQEQLEAVLENDNSVACIYVDSNLDKTGLDAELWKGISDRIHKKNIEVFLAMPRIFRNQTIDIFEQAYDSILTRCFDGMLIRSMEEYQFLKSKNYSGNIRLDYNLYIMNRFAKQFWKKQGVIYGTIPVELNKSEIVNLDSKQDEMIVYGYIPAMVTAQCVTSTVHGCKKDCKITMLKDRYQNEFPVKNQCRDCYNVIYNTAPLYLIDLKEDLEELNAERYRIQFSIENKDEVKQILEQCHSMFGDQKEDMFIQKESITRGHFRRGIS